MPRAVLDLPKGWTRGVRAAMVRAVALAHWSIVRSRSWAADSPLRRVRLASDLESARCEIAHLREEIRIKDARWSAIPPARRPRYSPTDRMAILLLRAARGWSAAQTARAFLLEPETIASWARRIHEQADHSLVRLPSAVNKFPDFVAALVRTLKTTCPAMGKKRIAQLLARAGLRLGTTTVGRMLKQNPPRRTTAAAEESPGAAEAGNGRPRTVTADYPDQLWHVDLTAVPAVSGLWVPWLPFALPQRWPFCWWVGAVVDHFSRKLVAIRVFRRPPTASAICRFLDDAIARSQAKPRYIVTDKGTQFWSAAFKSWCRDRDLRPRYGAIGRSGSIALIERFFRSLKAECARNISISLRRETMRRELGRYQAWYNRHRPHQALDGIPPEQRYLDSFGCESTARAKLVLYYPGAERHRANLRPMHLNISYLGGRKHLPLVQLKNAA